MSLTAALEINGVNLAEIGVTDGQIVVAVWKAVVRLRFEVRQAKCL